MKKTIALTTLLLISMSTFSFGAAYTKGAVTAAGVAVYGGADATTAAAASASGKSALFKLSTGVSAVINSDAAGIGYAVFTKHLKGTKTFGTSYDSTALSFKVGTEGILDASVTGSATAVPSGWETM